MGRFQGYRLDRTSDGNVIYLYIDPESTEFASEFMNKSTEENKDLIQEVMEYINKNLPDIKVAAVKIMVGTLLIATIPLGAARVHADEATPISQNSTTINQQSHISYTVVSGDSLWKIAQKFNVSVDRIKAASNLTSDTIYVNQSLKIPTTTITSPTPTPTPAPAPTTPAPTPSQTSNTYKVVSGDSLWNIARRFNTTVDNLRRLNNLTSDTIFVGQVIIVSPPISTAPYKTYTTHTVASGDNLWSISLKYGIPMPELMAENNLTQSSILRIGQVLRVPVHVIPVTQTPGPMFGEHLDWFKAAQYLLPIGKTARVIDVATGQSFHFKRTTGAFHADCEPLTAEDAATIKRIWGGSYSWATRAVIVEVDGRRIAASMSSMPHDVQHIQGNNFNGHFDLHFLNSTRHKDNLMDPNHQAQVRIAAGVR